MVFNSNIYCNDIFYYILKIKEITIKVVFLIAAIVISYNPYLKNIQKIIWNIDSVMMALPFISWGYYLKKKGAIHKLEKSYIIPLGTASMVVGGVFVMLNPISAVSFDDNRYGHLLLMFAGALLLSMSVVFFSSLSIYTQYTRFRVISSIVSFFGRHTLFIMGFDYLAGIMTEIIFCKLKLEMLLNWHNYFFQKSFYY